MIYLNSDKNYQVLANEWGLKSCTQLRYWINQNKPDKPDKP